MRLYLHCIFLTTGIFLALSCLADPPAPLASSPPQPLPEVRALLDQGKAEVQQGHQDQAEHLYSQALQLARDRKDPTGEAGALAGLGRAVLDKAPLQTMTYIGQALPIYQKLGDEPGQALCLLLLGYGAQITAQPQRALDYFDAAWKLYQKIGSKQGTASTLTGMGLLSIRIGQPHKAVEYLSRALAILEETGTLGRPLQLGAMVDLGAAYREAQDIPHALEIQEKALTLARELGNRDDEGILLMNIGVAHLKMTGAGKALEFLNQALPLLEEANDTTNLAALFSNISHAYSQEGDLLKSLEYVHHALDLDTQMGNQSGVARDLIDIAAFDVDVGQMATALEVFQKARQANQSTGDVLATMTILSDMGQVYGKLGQSKREQACYEQSLRLPEMENYKDVKATTLLYLSSSLMDSGKLQQALAYCEEARRLFQEISSNVGEAGAELQMGQLLEQQGQRSQARSHYERAQKIFQDSDNAAEEAEALALLGSIEEGQHLTSAADAHYTRALALLEESRASLGHLTEAKSSFLEKQIPVYQRYIRFLLQTGQNAKAFQWTQSAKARTLIDLMESGKVVVSQAMTEADRKQEEDLKRSEKALTQEWEAVTSELDDIQHQPQPDRNRQKQVRGQANSIREQQQRLEQQWRAFQEQLYLHNPRLAQQRVARTATLEETAAFLPADTALLDYCFLNARMDAQKQDEIVLFVVTHQSVPSHLRVCRMRMKAGALAQLTSDFREACAGRPGSQAERPYRELGRQLYKLLIAPAEAALTGKRRLILCPDGPLWNVPFQVLIAPPRAPSGKNETKAVSQEAFLWERFALVYGYSATGTKAALDARQQPNRPRPEQPLLVMANPAFGTNNHILDAREQPRRYVSRGLYERGGGLRALPSTLIEARAILSAYPQAMLKTGSDAQEALVKQTGANYRWLHFATHAVFNDAAPMMSGIILARPPQGSSEDGILTAHELFDLNLGADMLVLSACDTARGANKPGEGLIGLTWAAFVAGVPTQVVSQWSVDDAATAQLMGGFYQALKQGQSKDAALRKAALALLHDGNHQHPFYWAPFLVIGDWH